MSRATTSQRQDETPQTRPVDAAVVDRLLRQVSGLTARDLTEVIADEITSGSLADGTRLPTIRAVATASGASVSSVAAAWARLVERGLVQTHRRGGTVVVGTGTWPAAAPPRSFDGWASVDLATAHPSAEHLPDLGRAFEKSLREPRTHSLQREHVTDLLRGAVEPTWPFAAQEWSTVSGSGEATLMTCEAATPAGGAVAVQEPTTPGTIANLRSLGYTVVSVRSDAAGPRADDLEAALAQGATTFLYQPESTFTVGSRLTPERLDELAEVVERVAPQTWVVEEDVLAGLPSSEGLTLGGRLPERVVRLTSYCRAFGLDLRTTVIGGARPLVEQARRLRSHGIVAQSRILQNALAHMLLDPAALAFAAAASAEYSANAHALTAALAEHGVTATSPPGDLLVWVPARDEHQALAELATSGVNLVPGSRTFVSEDHPPTLRVATPQLPDRRRVDELARLLAGAARDAVVDA